METQITSDTSTEVAPYITEEDKAHHHSIFGRDYSSCLNWYKRAIRNLGVDTEIQELKRGNIRDNIPKEIETLMITGTRDAVCLAPRAEQAMSQSCEQGRLAVKHLDAGHWVLMERREEVNTILERFLEDGVAGAENIGKGKL